MAKAKVDVATAVDVKGILSNALHLEALKSTNDMKPTDAAKVVEVAAPKIEAAVNKEVGAIIENVTNQEPLWKSRHFWTYIAIAIGAAGSLAGFTFGAEDQKQAVDTVMGLVEVVGAGVAGLGALYGLVNRIFFAGKLKPLFTN